MADKYPTIELVGVVLEQTNSGQYVPKEATLSIADFHSWRIGKHTKGKLAQPGQIFLTENNQLVGLVATKPLAFKNRHEITPMGRFLKEKLDPTLTEQLIQHWQALV